jgi:carboxyl-terminal processing protease
MMKVVHVSSSDSAARPRSSLPIRVLAVLVLLLLWGFAASDRLPASINSAAHAAESDLQKSAKDKPDHDLSALRVFNRVVLLIKDNYYDPKRIQPRKMLVQALDNVERQVAEIMVDGDEKSSKLKVTVNKVSKEFDISGVDTFWRMSFALKDVFDFVNKNLSAQSKEDSRDIEYAAVNGMLSTLDPHSILLKPDYFKEMKLQTKGEFGGLGFIIQMKEGNLTVVRVLKGTPAQRAGIKSKDVIQRIGNESTVNMDLNDAVDRLRGKPGSDVSLTVLRTSWPAPKQMTLTRAVINVESVEAKLLENNVGYIKLKGFQGNTARDLHAELKRLKQEAQQNSRDPQKPGLKGVVLDLRGNPGGLLEQAIQISDAFVSEGTIVTTVGYSDKMREVKKAHADDTDTNLPLAVIVNSGSASASEIVAGALKNLNRAVIVGRQSFGKGSVQVLYDFPDESALKLTIAQYLTPGDVSIQEVGITPDIELVPSRVNKDRVDVFAPRKTMGEADLSGHFGNPNSDKVASKREEIAPKEKPLEELRFLRDEPPPPKDAKAAADKKDKPDRDDYEADDLEGEDPDTDEIVEDYQIRFARDLILAAPASTRDAMLRAAKPFIAGRRAEEAVRIEKAIEALGLDWNAGEMARAASGQAAPRLVYDMKPAAGQKVSAGDTLAWTVTIENAGTTAVHRLRAWSESENPYLDRREFLFGKLGPGEKKTWTVNVKLAKEMVSRRDDVTLNFFDDEGDKLENLKGEVNVVELPRPLFAYSWQIVDKCETCNGDGLAQPGETVELAVEVKNLGAGKAFDLLGSLKNKGDEKISLSKGRSKMGEVLPGQTKSATFEFQVMPDFKAQSAPLQLTLGDEATDEFVTEKISLPVSMHKEQGKLAQTGLRANADLPVYAAASETSVVIGTARKGAVLASDARFGNLYRIHLGNRLGFVAAGQVKEAKVVEAKAQPVEGLETRSEPKITLSVDTSAGGIATDGEKYTLSGSAVDKTGLRDLYVFVNEQKAFFESAKTPGANINFSVDLPLKVGNNSIVVVAREDQDFMARKLLIIHRRGDAPKTKVVELKPGARSPDAKERDDHRLRSAPEGGVVPAPVPQQ